MKKNIKIAHILLPSKFAMTIIDYYSCLEGIENIFCIYTERHESNINEDIPSVITVKYKLFINTINDLSPDVIIIHSIAIPGSLIERIPKKIKLIWHSWGYDIYGDCCDRFFPVKPIKLDLYKPKTRSLYNKKFKYNEFIFNIYFRLFYRGFYEKLFNRVDYISCILPNEKLLLEESDINSFKYIQLCYTSPTQIKQLEYRPCKGSNVLIGNSASATNNHLDIFDILKNIGTKKETKFVVPLSYGSKKYAKSISDNGRALLRDQYLPILNFLPLDEYDVLLKSCSYAIFGHIRQQAVGNILMCLIQGTKVFLYKDSIAYQYFKSIGCILFLIEKDLNSESIRKELSSGEKRHNFNIIKNRYYSQFEFNKIENEIRDVFNEK